MAAAEQEDVAATSPIMEAVRAHLHFKNAKMTVLFSSVIVYFVLAIAIYMPGEGWGAGDCIYFAVVVVTTVGFGDLLPTTPSMKIATILFAHFGLSIVVQALGVVQDMLTHMAMARALGAVKEGLFDTKGHHRKKRVRAAIFAFFYVVWVMIGTVSLGFMFKNHEHSDSEVPFLDGLYLTIITLTTIGFGDHSPKDDGSKFVCMILMLFGIPAFGSAFGAFNNAVFPDINSSPLVLQKIKGDFTEEKFESIHTFVQEMRKDGVDVGDDGEGRISRLEFMSFILVENGVVSLKNIRKTMKNFDKIDKDGTGFIEACDVAHARSGAEGSQSRTQDMEKAVGKPSDMTTV